MKRRQLRGNHALSLMYEFTRDLAGAGELDAVLEVIIAHIGRTFTCDLAILLPGLEVPLEVSAASPGFELTADERAVAEETYRRSESAGWGAAVHTPMAEVPARSGIFCLPLRTPRGTLGALCLANAESCSEVTGEPSRLLEVFCNQAALAIERAQLVGRTRQVELLQATEKLQTALLHSISHDLRTPLAIITVALSNLEATGERLDEATRQTLARTGRQEAERLNRMLGDLLEISRIEAGALRLTEELCDVEEAIGVVLDRLAPEEGQPPAGVEGVVEMDARPVAIEIPPGLAAVPMDLPLVVQALANVLDNAVKYSPSGTQIDITVCQTGEEVEIQVADRGPGAPPEDLLHIFDKFYRAQSSGGVHGSGLGLAISKGIVEAHGGRIWAAERPGGGMVFTIALPLARPASAERS